MAGIVVRPFLAGQAIETSRELNEMLEGGTLVLTFVAVASQLLADIGYHFLVDKFGNTFEGRSGSMTGLPKGGRGRTVDLPGSVVDALNSASNGRVSARSASTSPWSP